MSGWSFGSSFRSVAILFGLFLWFPNDYVMRVLSLGCYINAAALQTVTRTFSSLHPGLAPAAQEIPRLHHLCDRVKNVLLKQGDL